MVLRKKVWLCLWHHPQFRMSPDKERGLAGLCALPAGSVPPVLRSVSCQTIAHTAGGLGTPWFCEYRMCFTAIEPGMYIAVEVTEDAWTQMPSQNDKPYYTHTEMAPNQESGTTKVSAQYRELRRRHVRQRVPPMTHHLCTGRYGSWRSARCSAGMVPRILAWRIHHLQAGAQTPSRQRHSGALL